MFLQGIDMFSKKTFILLLPLAFIHNMANAEISEFIATTKTNTEAVFKQTVYDTQMKGVVSQRLDTSCGGAALAMLFQNQFNMSMTENHVIDFVINKRGTAFDSVNFDDMMEFAEQNGVDGLAQFTSFADMEKLTRRKLPFIVRVKGINADKLTNKEDKYQYHFVVVKGIANNLVSISDPIPEIGNQTYTKEQFLEMIDFNQGKGKVFFLLPKENGRLKMDKSYVETPQYYPFENRMPNFIRF